MKEFTEERHKELREEFDKRPDSHVFWYLGLYRPKDGIMWTPIHPKTLDQEQEELIVLSGSKEGVIEKTNKLKEIGVIPEDWEILAAPVRKG